MRLLLCRHPSVRIPFALWLAVWPRPTRVPIPFSAEPWTARYASVHRASGWVGGTLWGGFLQQKGKKKGLT